MTVGLLIRVGVLAATLATGSLWDPVAALADPRGCDATCWQEALQAYAVAPRENRRYLLALEKSGTGGLPAVALLALADARLRGGQSRSADRLLAKVIDEQPGGPWAGWATTGRGWIALQRGDVDGARLLLASAVYGENPDRLLSFTLGLLEAAQGNQPEGIRLMSALATDHGAPRSVRLAAEMGLGLAYYWAGRNAEALSTFSTLAARPEASAIADEARYAAARVQLTMGERAAARRALEALAEEGSAARATPRSSPRVSEEMLNLDPRALRRKGARLYRGAPLGLPIQLALQLLDWDGRALARALLAILDAGEELAEPGAVRGESPGIERVATGSAVREFPATEHGTARQNVAAGDTPHHPAAASTSWPWFVLIILSAGLVAGLDLVRRQRRRSA